MRARGTSSTGPFSSGRANTTRARPNGPGLPTRVCDGSTTLSGRSLTTSSGRGLKFQRFFIALNLQQSGDRSRLKKLGRLSPRRPRTSRVTVRMNTVSIQEDRNDESIYTDSPAQSKKSEPMRVVDAITPGVLACAWHQARELRRRHAPNNPPEMLR